jgi:hypothetical protein
MKRLAIGLLLVSGALSTLGPQTARADEQSNEASEHFHRGVALYKEGNFAGSLVEFRRAYQIAPHYRVLYNLGRASLSLQRYADAQRSFEAYLAEGGAEVPEARRTEVQGELALLERRVARLEVVANMPGAEIMIDGESVGTSPLAHPVVVSVGRVRITALKSGKVPLERTIEVVGGDHTKVQFEFPPDSPPPALAPVVKGPAPKAPDPRPMPPASPSLGAGVWAGWVATGLLAAGATTFGVLSLKSKQDLSNELDRFPADQRAVGDLQSRTKTFLTVTDVLLASAVVVGSVTLFFTLRGPSQSRSRVGVGVAPGGVSASLRF